MNSKASRQSPAVLPHDRFVGGSAIRGDSGGQISADSSTRPAAQSGWGSGRPVRRLGVMSVLGMLGFLFIANLSVALFVNNERFLYFYDGAGWWEWSKQYMSLQSQSVLQAIKGVLETIKTKDQNLVAAVPVGTWMGLAGDSRLSYVLAVTNIYGGACLLALMVLARSFWDEREAKRGGWIELVPAAVLLLIPAFWMPILRGYIEAGGVALALAVLWLYFSSTERRPHHPAYLAIGFLLAGLFIFRRRYAFWVVAFLAVATLDRAALAAMDMRANGFSFRRLARLTFPVPVMGLVALLALASVAMPMIRRVLGTNYADLYSAYNISGGLFANLEFSLRPFGWLPLLFALGSLLFLSACRATRRMSLFVAAQAALIAYMFLRVQFLMMSHLFMFLPGYLLVACVATSKVASLLPNRWLRAGWLGLLLSAGAHRVSPDVLRGRPPARRTARPPHAGALPAPGPERPGRVHPDDHHDRSVPRQDGWAGLRPGVVGIVLGRSPDTCRGVPAHEVPLRRPRDRPVEGRRQGQWFPQRTARGELGRRGVTYPVPSQSLRPADRRHPSRELP